MNKRIVYFTAEIEDAEAAHAFWKAHGENSTFHGLKIIGIGDGNPMVWAEIADVAVDELGSLYLSKDKGDPEKVAIKGEIFYRLPTGQYANDEIPSLASKFYSNFEELVVQVDGNYQKVEA
jgi:hypothetical protein